MTDVVLPSVFEELIDYFAAKATPAEVLAFHISESAQARADELLMRLRSGILTPAEQIELEQMRYFDGIMSVLKAKALNELNRS